MRKIATFTILLLSLSLSMIMVNQAKASPSIAIRWQDPYYHGYDDFYGPNPIYAYKAGTEASIIVQVTNDGYWDKEADVTVKLEIFGENETSEETLVKIDSGRTSIFTVKVDVPADATNLFRQAYVIYVKFEVETEIKWERFSWSGVDADFVVYTQDQAEARRLKTELGYWPTGQPSGYGVIFMQSSETWELFEMASIEKKQADYEYAIGHFSSAKTHYESSLNYTKEAIKTFVSKSSTYEDAMLSLFTAGSGLMNFYGIALLIGGIGFLLMGIGVMVYLVRRPTHSTPPT